uniref:DRBM domain-containing protein n=1 Tax=Neogobius melanostomus TaxID=47308 RepID=A0A8C6U9S4_9GOBI
PLAKNAAPTAIKVFELAAKHRLDACFLELDQHGPIHNATFTIRLTVGRLTAEAQGPTKIIAKTLAAQQILPELRCLPVPAKMPAGNSAQKAKLWRKLRPLRRPLTPSCVCMI